MKKQLLSILLFVFSVTQTFSQSGFSIEKDSSDTVYSYHFTPIVTLGDSFYWTFSDGDSSFVAPASHTYDTLGNYEVCLTVLDTADTTVYCDSVVIECLEVSANIGETHSGSLYFFRSNALNASSFYWDFGDSSAHHPTIANPSHYFPWSVPDTHPCEFVVTLKAFNFSDTTTDQRIIFPDGWSGWDPCGWSISELESASSIVISPNPTNTQLTLSSAENFTIQNIKSINGQVVLTDFEKTRTSQKEINVSALPSGFYFLEYEMDGIVKNQRFAVQH